MYRIDLVPTKELREMALQVLHVEEKDCWPGSGEVPQWVRAIGEQLPQPCHDWRMAAKSREALEYVPKVCSMVRHEILRRFVCEPVN